MKSLSSLGIGLSAIFVCLLLALVAELYYLFWWKRRINNTDIEDDYSGSTKELFYLLCLKRPSPLSSSAINPHTPDAYGHESDEPVHQSPDSGMDFVFKPFGEDSVQAEIMRLHHLPGPPRFLFTIKEETKEDMESDDAKSCKSKVRSRGRSLSDVLLSVETPFLTPLSSPPFLTPPLTPTTCCLQNGFNPLFESSAEAEMMRRMSSSPPPKFKFLKDAEEKLYRKRVMEGPFNLMDDRPVRSDLGTEFKANNLNPPSSSSKVSGEGDGSFTAIPIGKNMETEFHACSSQVVPLHSSPPEIRTGNRWPIIVEK